MSVENIQAINKVEIDTKTSANIDMALEAARLARQDHPGWPSVLHGPTRITLDADETYEKVWKGFQFGIEQERKLDAEATIFEEGKK